MNPRGPAMLRVSQRRERTAEGSTGREKAAPAMEGPIDSAHECKRSPSKRESSETEKVVGIRDGLKACAVSSRSSEDEGNGATDGGREATAAEADSDSSENAVP